MYYLLIILLIFRNVHGLEQQLFNKEKFQIYGADFAVNEYMAVFFENNLQQFTITPKPFSSHPKPEVLPYLRVVESMNLTQYYVYIHAIVTGTKPNHTHSVFAMIGEDKNQNFYLIVMVLSIDTINVSPTLSRQLAKPYELENLPLGIHPHNSYVCVVQLTGTLCLDISLNTTQTYENTNLWDQTAYILGQAIVVTDDHHLFLLAYRVIESQEKSSPYLYSTLLSNTSASKPLAMIDLSTNYSNHHLFEQKQYSMLSMCVHEESNMIVVGIPLLDTVVILSVQEKAQSLVINKKHVSSQIGTFFGKSVAILDNSTYAVLAQSIPTLPWSSSQIQASRSIDLKCIRQISVIDWYFIGLFYLSTRIKSKTNLRISQQSTTNSTNAYTIATISYS
jgi:hypothetical protein